MLLEKVGMRTHALKNQVLAVDFVNEQPIRFDETVMSPLPITDKIVIAVNGVQRLIGEQGSRNNFEFFRILSTAQAPFQVLFKLTRINRNKHALKPQLFKQVIGVLAYRQVTPGIRVFEGALSRFVGNGDLKGQALMQLNLLVEKGNCLCGVQADPAQYFFRTFFEFRLNPGSYHCAFTHDSASIVGFIVAQTGYRQQVYFWRSC
jgi:hypothetical protein